LLLNLVDILQLLGDFAPDPSGKLLSPDPLNQPSHPLVYSTNTTLAINSNDNKMLSYRRETILQGAL